MPHGSGFRRAIATALLVGAVITPALEAVAAGSAPRYVAPVPGGAHGASHAGYPAADIFRACGALVVAPASGTLVLVDRVDGWSPGTDDPWARGGLSVAIRDGDGVRHYLAHFDRIRRALDVGDEVVAGERLGRMGATGRASACHTHYGISPRCRGHVEWWVRRGVVAPQRFLADWEQGVMTSPARAVRRWARTHDGACRDSDVIGAE